MIRNPSDGLVRSNPAHARAMIHTKQPPLPPPVPSETPPRAPCPPPSPPSSPLYSSSPPPGGPVVNSLKPTATSTPLLPTKSAARSQDKDEAQDKDEEQLNKADDGGVGSVLFEKSLNRSVVSETNKIGIKFDQTEDYGPLDERAGNFTKLQCILRSRKKPVSKTPQEKPKTRTTRVQK